MNQLNRSLRILAWGAWHGLLSIIIPPAPPSTRCIWASWHPWTRCPRAAGSKQLLCARHQAKQTRFDRYLEGQEQL